MWLTEIRSPPPGHAARRTKNGCAATSSAVPCCAVPRRYSGGTAVSSQRDPQRRAYRATALEGGAAVVHVTRAALSSDGSHLASLESRADAELAQTLTLKFWTLADGRWLECARVDRPHSAEATALAFHPHVMLVVTTGRDARFKLWEGSKPPPPRARGAPPAPPPPRPAGPPTHSEAAGERVVWACRSVGDYTTSAATAAAFSPPQAQALVDRAHAMRT